MLGIGLVLCAALLGILMPWSGASAQAKWFKAFTVLFFALLWIPVGTANIPVVAYVRGITADLSITLISLAIWRMAHLARSWRAMPKREEQVVMTGVALAALVLYPSALGWGDWDTYRPGWGSWGMLLTLLLISGACWVNGLRVVPALVALALLAWSFGLMESTNLWDYLLDPWLSIYALCFVFIKCVQAVFRRFVR